MLRMFTMVSSVFASVSDAYFKCFICFLTYVVIAASGCFKTRSSEASLSLPFFAVSPRCQARKGRGGPHWCGWTPCACGWAQQGEMWASRRWRPDIGLASEQRALAALLLDRPNNQHLQKILSSFVKYSPIRFSFNPFPVSPCFLPI